MCRRDLEQSGEEESLSLEGDIGDGLILQRHISIPKDSPKVLRIDSSIIARSVGAGSGGYSRLVRMLHKQIYRHKFFALALCFNLSRSQDILGFDTVTF